jgi:RNA polymerase sigma-70 factor (ECF subfamily)
VDELDLLVAAARTGGGWAFGRLWEQLAPSVAAYLRGRGVRDADDVTSEVFLAAFRGIGGFHGDGVAFRSWLFTIAHHKGVDVHRRPATREVLVDAVGAAGLGFDPAPARSAEDVAMEQIAGDGAVRQLATLTDDQRAVLLLRVVADLSLAETAEVLGKPVGAVKALQHRALARLRADLGAVSREPGGAMGRMT